MGRVASQAGRESLKKHHKKIIFGFGILFVIGGTAFLTSGFQPEGVTKNKLFRGLGWTLIVLGTLTLMTTLFLASNELVTNYLSTIQQLEDDQDELSSSFDPRKNYHV